MQSQFQAVMLTPMEAYSTMLKLPAMDYYVHHTILRRSSPVLCALSDIPEH